MYYPPSGYSMAVDGVTILDLPPLRGNPFDLRPIESARSDFLIGRDKLLSQWREYLISQNPRMLLLVGDRGSGRTSFINTLAAQTSRRSYIGQYWPEADDTVHGLIHEISIHFGGFELAPSIQQVSDRLVEMLDNESGVLPLIVFDYPSHIDLNPTLSRLAPLLQRLRALVVVAVTPSQLSNLSQEVLDIFDQPQMLSNLTEDQIQVLSNRRVSRSANQKWIIRPSLLKAIHENTDGNPRSVVRLLRDLVDERHDPEEGGVLDRLMTWRAPPRVKPTPPPASPEPLIEEDISEDKEESIQTDAEDDWFGMQEETLEENQDNDFEDDPPDDLWDEEETLDSEPIVESEPSSWNDDFSAPDDIWEGEDKEEESKEIELQDEEERIQEIEEQSSLEDNIGDEYQRTEADNAFLYMEDGTEPPSAGRGNFGSLVNRNRRAADRMPTGPDETPIMEAEPHPSLIPRSIREPVDKMKPESVGEKDSMARIDVSVDPVEDEHVFHTENALWVVEPGFEETLPDPSVFPPPEPKSNPEPEPIETEWFVDDSVDEESPMPVLASEEIIPPLPTPVLTDTTVNPPPSQIIPTTIQFPASIGPSWEPDMPFDPLCLHTLTEAERMILEASASREVSPSDQELQARLEVGRSRLSQIYNGMRKKGLLSVRKQGRTRYFKLSEASAQHLGGAPKGVA